MPEISRKPRASKLPLVVMGGVVTLAMLITVALTAFPRTQSFDPGTPEAVVQDFIEAGLDDDQARALDLLAPRQRVACTSEFERIEYGARYFGDDLRAILESSAVEGDRAIVEVEFRRSNANDPFDSSTSSFPARYELVRVDDAWQIDMAGWPSAFARCNEGGS